MQDILTVEFFHSTHQKSTSDLHQKFQKNFQESMFPFLAYSEWQASQEQLSPILNGLSWVKTYVILGTGGSSLGGQALYGLAQYKQEKGPQVFFLDDIDPFVMNKVFTQIDLASTFFIVISKSGYTVETLAQVLSLESYFAPKGLRRNHQFLFITHDRDTPMRRVAKKWNSYFLPHSESIGGRFSVLTLVGTVVARILNLCVSEIHEGAQDMLADIQSQNDHTAILSALYLDSAYKEEKSNHVLMPYGHVFQPFVVWYRQLVAESLGKQGLGVTPIQAAGTIDQHSQLQLYLDGPHDKYFTFMEYSSSCDFSMSTDDSEIDFLNQRNPAELFAAEAKATRISIGNRGIPYRLIRIKNVNEYTWGAMFVYFMVETILFADLLSVNPFDQPAVEEGKQLTRTFMKG